MSHFKFYSNNRILVFLLFLFIFSSCKKEEPPIIYKLTISANTGGLVSTQGGEYESGTMVSISATPNAEYVFNGWSNGSSSNPLTITVSSNQSIQANFIKRKYALTINIEGEGTVTEEIVSAGKDYDSGTVVKLTAVPSDDWSFTEWSGAANTSELSIQLTISEAKTLNAVFSRSSFISKGEQYSEINKTTGYYNNQSNFFRYITKEEAESLSFGENPIYRVQGRQTLTYDFNKDGRLDLFGFAINFESNIAQAPYGVNHGKLFIIDDFFSGNREMKLFDTQELWVGGDLLLGDSNNDGALEVLLFSNNRHQNVTYNVSNPSTSILEVSIDTNFNLTSRYLGNPIDLHNGSLGDIDIDGDIDLVQWPIGMPNTPIDDQWPNLLINDGSGNFTTIDLFSNEKELRQKYYNWTVTVSQLFDLNNDGYLDLICGWHLGNREPEHFPNILDMYDRVNIFAQVIWGDGSGQFNSNNTTIIQLSANQNISLAFLGAGFTDFDNDGDVDIVLTSTRSEINGNFNDGTLYDNYVLNLVENKGDKTFTDVTNSYLDGNIDLSLSKFTHFYEPYFIDKDNDGDYDLVPGNVSNWAAFDIISNLYWEKQGKKYIRKELNDNQ